MKKRLLSIILTLCMVMSITPLNAFAVTEYGIWIGEEQVTSVKHGANRAGNTIYKARL